MFAPIRIRGIQSLGKSIQATVPDFLVPSLTRRTFSITRIQESRIGSAPLRLPDGVVITIIDPPKSKDDIEKRFTPHRKIQVKGPTGELFVDLPHYMSLHQDHETRKVTLSVEDRTVRKQREMWGTTRAVLNNHIMGLTEGHTAILRLNGLGYRAMVESTAQTKKPEFDGQKFVTLKLGYSHPIELPVPKGITATAPQPTRILLEGSERERINQFAAEIRNWKKPEPYKGKGIFVNGETIRLKSKKVK